MSDRPSSAPSDPPIFDPAAATALIAECRRFFISLPILRALVTNPGSEKVSWRPIFNVRMTKLNTLRMSLDEITRAYERKNNKTKENDELAHAVRERYLDCVEGLFAVVDAHKEALPVNERLAAEAAELRARKRERLEMAMERSQLGRQKGAGDSGAPDVE
jgi:hypothetical protein